MPTNFVSQFRSSGLTCAFLRSRKLSSLICCGFIKGRQNCISHLSANPPTKKGCTLLHYHGTPSNKLTTLRTPVFTMPHHIFPSYFCWRGFRPGSRGGRASFFSAPPRPAPLPSQMSATSTTLSEICKQGTGA